MKKLIYLILCGATVMGATSCKKYLEIVPKGQKIPQTIEDYRALLESQKAHLVDFSQQSSIANEWSVFPGPVSMSLVNINYYWMSDQDKLQYLQTDQGYNDAYASIFAHNVIINHVGNATTGTDSAKATLIAQAKVARSIHYFYLVNSYAKTYDAATAATDKGVLINTSDEMEQKLTQSSVKEVYDFIIKDLNDALPHLPNVGATQMMPGKGAAYAALARIYMFQRDYTKAAEMVDKALAINSQLFDYVQYYLDNKKLADSTASSITIPKYEFNNVENYVFSYGGSSARMQGFYISVFRPVDTVLYDKGDARLKVNFAPVKLGTDYVMAYRRRDDPNVGGLRTPEMYYYKAECLARAGKYSEAMDVLNTVRRKRIITEFYTNVSAATEEQAIALIRREMRCEYRGYGLWYLDYRRFNMDPKYKAALTKVEANVNYTLAPDSRLWILPFSQTAIAYGEGRLVQNYK